MKHESIKGVGSFARAWGQRGLSAPKKKVEAAKQENPFVYVPMGQTKPDERMGLGKDKKPVHVMKVSTRGEYLNDWLNTKSWREYSGGTCYKAIIYGWVFLALTVATFLWVNVYVAAVFAYLTGLMRSQYLMGSAWNLSWFKGKALIATV